MQRPLRRTLACASLLLSTALFPAHAWAAPESIVVALPGDFPSLIPSDDSSPLGFNYRLNVFDQLTLIERDGSISPRLATAWTVSEDLKTWTFTLRDDVTFHDGSPLTAEDVAFTAQYILDNPRSPTRTFLRLVTNIEVPDPTTITFTLSEPYAFFERQISFVNVMSKAYHEAVGDAGYGTTPLGSGPYKFVEWIKDDRLSLEAYESYWNGASEIKQATFRPIPAEASRATALMSGEVDLVTSLPPALLERLRTVEGVSVGTAPGSRVIFFGMNVNTPPLDDARIREAIDLAIDREAITTSLLRGLGTPAGMLIPPNNVGYNPAFQPVKQDLERARALVTEAGYDGTPIPIEYPSNNIVMANEIVQVIAGYLEQAGLKTEIRPAEFTAFFPKWAQTGMDAGYMFAYGSTQYHADTILTAMYATGGRVYKMNEEINELVSLQRRTVDKDEQMGVLSKIFELAAEDRYNIPLFEEHNAFGVKSDIAYEPWPDGFVRLYDIE